MYKNSIEVFESFLADQDLRHLLFYSIYHELIEAYYPSSLYSTEDFQQDQLYYYEKLCLIVRCLYLHDGRRNTEFY